jgi:site-specific recombinase XerD
VDVLLAGFGAALEVSPPVVAAYQRYVRPFLAWLADRDGQVDLAGLDARAVAGFLAGDLPGGSAKRAQMTACAVRCFLRYAHDAGLVGVDLSAAVPAVPSRRAGLPRALTGEQMGLLLGACDRSTPVGRRDYAVVVCLARLGLRAGEVGGLALSAIDWPAGVVTVHGKGGRVDQLPIPVDVGAAIAAYLRHGRPHTSSSTVFVRSCAPFTALTPSSVSCIVARAATRAGLGTVHAHRLRHTAATSTLNAGASLGEVSLLLRHASPATTTVYAKADLDRLARIARPWPGAC